jgi:hypothetical protein
MRLLVWLNDRRIGAIARYRTRRAFRRHRLSPAAQQRLRDAAKRGTP